MATRVISPAELRGNMKKYLDLAVEQNEVIIIQRGKKQSFVLVAQGEDDTEADLKRAISMDEFKKGVHEDIADMYKARKR